MNISRKISIACVAGILLCAVGIAHAQPENVNNNNCNGRGSCSDGGQPGGNGGNGGNGGAGGQGGSGGEQQQQQGQIQLQGQVLDNNVTSDSSSRADAHSQSSSDSSSSADATGGSATASGGQSASDSSSNSGGNSTTTVVEGDDYAASSAASVYSAYCQQGASGQGMGGGGAVTGADVLCDHLKVADRFLIAYEQQKAWCKELDPACDEGKKAAYLYQYQDNMEAVDRIMRQTSITGQVAKTSGQLVWPMVIIYALFML